MDYNLENKILLSEESKDKSSYAWSLQEFDKDDKHFYLDESARSCSSEANHPDPFATRGA